MEGSIAVAHRRIDALLEAMEAALHTRDQAVAEDAFAQLREALEAHFDQEDRLYYPPIRTLRPELKPTMDDFGAAHDSFRSQFAAIHSHLEKGSLAEAEHALDEFRRAFTVHEAAEEKMLGSLDRDLGLPG
jgi:hemerythrin